MYTFRAHDEFQRAWLALPLKPYCLIPVVSLLGCMNLVTAAILVKIHVSYISSYLGSPPQLELCLSRKSDLLLVAWPQQFKMLMSASIFPPHSCILHACDTRTTQTIPSSANLKCLIIDNSVHLRLSLGKQFPGQFCSRMHLSFTLPNHCLYKRKLWGQRDSSVGRNFGYHTQSPEFDTTCDPSTETKQVWGCPGYMGPCLKRQIQTNNPIKVFKSICMTTLWSARSVGSCLEGSSALMSQCKI